MAIMSKLGLIEQAEQHVLSVRSTIHFDDYPQVAARAYGKIEDYAAESGLLFSGCPFVCYHNADLERLDVEIGFPFAKPVLGSGEIVGRTIPAQRAVAGIFLGAYGSSDLLMMEIMRWIAEHGHEQQGTIFNYYLNDADRPESDLLTQIVVPIK